MSEFIQRIHGSGSPTSAEIVSISPSTAAAGDTLTVYATRLRLGDTFKVDGVTMLITDAKYGLPDSGGLPFLKATLPAHADGTVNVELISVHSPPSGSATVPFTYESPVTSYALVFASAFPTLGNAVDTGNTKDWDSQGGNGHADVVTAASLALPNWPHANALHVWNDGSGVGGTPPIPDGIEGRQLSVDLGRDPQAGDFIYGREYYNVLYPDARGDSAINLSSFPNNVEHGMESKAAPAFSGGGTGANIYILPKSDGTYRLGWRDITVGRRWVARDIALTKGATYRREFSIEFLSDRYKPLVYVYDHNNNLVIPPDAFLPLTSGGGATTTMDQDSVPVDMTNLAVRQRFRCWRCGTNGPTSNWPLSGNSGVTTSLWAIGGVAYSFTNFPGVYVPGEAP